LYLGLQLRGQTQD